MTCIVGLVDSGRVFIGGDSLAGNGLDALPRTDVKVFENAGYLFGFTTSYRMGQLLRYSLQPPKRHPDRDVFSFMVTDFIDAVRNCLKAGGWAKRESENEVGGEFLVGYEGRLFSVHGDYQVAESSSGFNAVGCGELIARGSLFSTQGMDPTARVTRALEAAATFSMGVRAPFTIITTPGAAA